MFFPLWPATQSSLNHKSAYHAERNNGYKQKTQQALIGKMKIGKI